MVFKCKVVWFLMFLLCVVTETNSCMFVSVSTVSYSQDKKIKTLKDICSDSIVYDFEWCGRNSRNFCHRSLPTTCLLKQLPWKQPSKKNPNRTRLKQ